MANSLFIGITTWNSGHFIGHCIDQIHANTKGEYRVLVIDNGSTDNTEKLVRDRGAEFIALPKNQGDALNYLFTQSTADYTLLIHADTILLSENWFENCVEHFTPSTVLVSPQDIGCGPMTRDFGKNKPESSFMLFATARAKRLARWRVRRRRFRIPLEIKRDLPFYGDHITHDLPQVIANNGMTWHAMQVHTSAVLPKPWYQLTHRTKHWDERMASLDYGLGNFYSIGGQVTHYHNWYERVQTHAELRSSQSTGRNNEGFPTDFVRAYSERFLNDLTKAKINVPDISTTV